METDPHALPTQAWARRFVGFDACALGAIAVTELGEIEDGEWWERIVQSN